MSQWIPLCSLHRDFLPTLTELPVALRIPFCVASDNIRHLALLFPSGMSFLTTKEGMAFRGSLQSAQQVRQSTLFFSYLSRGKQAEAKPCKIHKCMHQQFKTHRTQLFFEVVVNGVLPTSPSLLLGVPSQTQPAR